MLRDFDDDDEFDEFYDFSESYKNGEEFEDVVENAKSNITVKIFFLPLFFFQIFFFLIIIFSYFLNFEIILIYFLFTLSSL